MVMTVSISFLLLLRFVLYLLARCLSCVCAALAYSPRFYRFVYTTARCGQHHDGACALAAWAPYLRAYSFTIAADAVLMMFLV